MAAPMVAAAQTISLRFQTSLRFQSTWPAKNIFRGHANDLAKKVNDMAGNRLRIEVLPFLAIVLLYLFSNIGLWLPKVLYG